MKKIFRACGLIAAWVAITVGGGVAVASEKGQDHPAVSRYPGSVLKDYDFKEFEQGQLILSKPYYKGSNYVADKVLPVEGAVTYLHYEIDTSVSAFQVFRNYQSALRRSGFKELFVCERPCIADNLGSLRTLLQARDLYLNGHQDIQYLSAQRGTTYVSLAVNSFGSGSSTNAWLFVIDKGSLDDGKMAVTGDSPIAKALASDGRVDLYGFYFDTGKAKLQPSSEKTLAELGQVLKDNPSLNIQVIGHTDNVGGDDANLALSQARAQSVAAALVSQKGIAAGRVQSLGLGASQPVAPNTNEDGRARNRRVEIVALPLAGAAINAATSTSGATTTANRRADAAPPAPAPQAPAPDKSMTTEDAVRKAREGADTVNNAAETVRSLRNALGF